MEKLVFFSYKSVVKIFWNSEKLPVFFFFALEFKDLQLEISLPVFALWGEELWFLESSEDFTEDNDCLNISTKSSSISDAKHNSSPHRWKPTCHSDGAFQISVFISKSVNKKSSLERRS